MEGPNQNLDELQAGIPWRRLLTSMEKKHTGLPWLPVHELSLEFGAFSKLHNDLSIINEITRAINHHLWKHGQSRETQNACFEIAPNEMRPKIVIDLHISKQVRNNAKFGPTDVLTMQMSALSTKHITLMNTRWRDCKPSTAFTS